jgi:hypothetical protein
VSAPRPEDSIHGAAAITGALQLVDQVVGTSARRVFGLATVDIDRKERDLVASFGRSAPVMSRDLPDDTQLGARCRLVMSVPGAVEILLLEPITEGRIAASLARFDEGVVAVYAVVSGDRLPTVRRDLRAGGLTLSGEGPGPFGPQHLVVGAPRWGAHLLIAGQREPDHRRSPTRAATIEP